MLLLLPRFHSNRPSLVVPLELELWRSRDLALALGCTPTPGTVRRERPSSSRVLTRGRGVPPLESLLPNPSYVHCPKPSSFPAWILVILSFHILPVTGLDS